MTDRSRRWPLTYVECRERFRWAAAGAGAVTGAVTIDGRGPTGEELTIDTAYLGPDRPERAVVLMSGTHGVEGFAGSTIQTDLLDRLAAPRVDGPDHDDAAAAGPTARLGSSTGLLLIHGANPWGMAWWRRANENNVDLNRNWQDFDSGPPPMNEAYDQVHELLCPEDEADGLGGADRFVAELGRLVEANGIAWIRTAVAGGQYRHPDGLYHGGHRREPSTLAVERLVTERLTGVDAVLAIDLHTGHGRYGTYTLLSPAALDGDQDVWVRANFDADRVTATRDPGQDETVEKVGLLLAGAVGDLGARRTVSMTFELGTRSETRMIVAERAEHWVHRFGDRAVASHAAAVWEHRACSIPDDPAWEDAGLANGRLVVDRALDAVDRL